MKVWSLFKPFTTAELFKSIEEKDENGFVPAQIVDPDMLEGRPFYGLVKPEEWAPFEVVPVPVDVPEHSWLVIYGDDPTLPKCVYYATEQEAKADVANRSNAFGHVPVHVPRFGMQPK